MDIPQGSIPAEEFQPMESQSTDSLPEGAIPSDQFQTQEQAYGTPGQQAITALEGVAKGFAGPLATAAEKYVLKVPEEAIRGRESVNPIIHGAGEVVGLGGGIFTGTGEAAVMAKAGEAAAAASGLMRAGEAASVGAKIGSEAIKQAAEMAVLQSGDEASKMILNDPDSSAQSAIANVGLSALFGAGAGALVTGVVSPIWKATAGPAVEEFLGTLKNHLNGGSKLVMAPGLEEAASTLGVQPDALMRAAMSGDPKAQAIWSELKEAQRPEILNGIKDLHDKISQSVMDSLKVSPEDIAVRSEAEAGRDLLDTFKREYNEKYEPIADALQRRNTEAAGIKVSDDARLDQYGQLVEQGMKDYSVNTPYYKLYEDYGQRLLDAESIGAMDKIKTEINNRLKGMIGPGTDYNTKNALTAIKSSIHDFQEAQISKAYSLPTELSDLGLPEGARASMTLAERNAINQKYAEFAKMSDELTNHLNIGDFYGAGSLKRKLTDDITPEKLLSKFSIRNNADFIPFLEKNFPETLEAVKAAELKKLISPAVLAAKDEQPINVSKLNKILATNLSGKEEYIKSIMPQGALEKTFAADRLMQAIPNPKSSGTAGWMTKLYKHMPANAMAAVSFVMGHNPISGFLVGELANRLSRQAPEAIKLGYLKFLASDKPLEAGAMKAGIDYLHSALQAQKTLARSTKAIFKPSAQIFTSEELSNMKDNEKLDKIVEKSDENPNILISKQGDLGHYFPDHQTALSSTMVRAVNYLKTVKPQEQSLGPLDKPMPVSPAQEARYQRALGIANNPLGVLQRIKSGTLQASDIQDLNGMYPELYKTMVNRITNEMISRHGDEYLIPYKTRMSISLFLGQPMDVTMQPQSIMAAQPMPKPAPQPQPQAPVRRGTTTLGKMNKSFMTTTQSAEADRSGRD